MTLKSFRDRMVAAFENSKLTKAELARRSEVSYDIINKLLRGDNQTTSPDRAARIAEVLGFQATDLGFRENHQPRINVSKALANDNPSIENSSDDPINTIKLAVVNDQVQVAATVDANSIDELIRRLTMAKEMIQG